MKRTLFLSIALSIAWQLSSLPNPGGAHEDKANALIAKARQALGGDAKLKAVKSLAISGKYRRTMGDREMSGDSEIEMLLPEKIRRSETMTVMGGVEITRIDALNGTDVWSDSQSNGAMGGAVVIRRAPDASPEAKVGMENGIRGDLTRLSLAFLLISPAGIPLQYTYVGEAEAPDGKAEVIDATGPNNFAARIFLDQKTSKPLMFTYKGRQPRIAIRTSQGGHREEVEKQAQEEAAKAAATPEVEFQVSLDDYREVNGILFPHVISRMVDGKAVEEMEVKKITVNGPIKPERFEKK